METQEIGSDGAPSKIAVEEKSTAELLKDLASQTTTLVHQEIELAKAELTVKGKRLGMGAGLFGGAGLLGVLALGAFVTAAIAAVSVALPVWAAGLIVGAALSIVAGVLALTGTSEAHRGTPPIPEQAVRSTKEDVAWLKTRARSAKP